MSLGPGGAYRGPVIRYQWRGDFASAEVEVLHAEGFGRAPADHDWKAQVQRHSLGWVCARRGAELAGFVNVAWDGGVHAFILDTVVAGPLRRHGVGTRLVEVAAREAGAAGCGRLSPIHRRRTSGTHGRLARDPARLAASLEEFAGHPAYGLDQLRDDLERFAFLPGGSDGKFLFGPPRLT